MKISITKNAYNVICEESLEKEAKQTETGGLLIGTLNIPIVIHALRPGKNAEFSRVHFKPDAIHDKQILDRTIKEYKGRVKLLGYWHKHTGRLSTPSMGDYLQTKELLKKFQDNNPYYVFITNVFDDKVKVYTYSLHTNDIKFRKISLKIIDNGALVIQEVLNKEPITLMSQKTNYWSDSDFQFYLTETGKKRLENDIKQIRTCYSVYLLRERRTKKLLIKITKDLKTLICVPPAEYPLNPPSFYYSNNLLSLNLSYWNSDFHLKFIVDKAFKQILQEKEKATARKRRLKDESLYFESLNKGIKRFINGIRQICKDFWCGKTF